MWSRKAFQSKSNPPNNVDSEQTENFLIQDFWGQGTDGILGVLVVNMDTASYKNNTQEKSHVKEQEEQVT